jgi:hypothetical protein
MKAKADKAKVKYTGFVAQEVEEAAKKMNYDFSGVDAPNNEGDLYGLRYSQFVVPLVKSVQDLNKKLEEENKELKERLLEQDNKISKLEEMMTKILNGQSLTTSGVNNSNVSVSGAYLLQNAPNPSNGTTIIRYHLPQGSGSARVVITNAKGQLLKSIAINGSGNRKITLDGSTFAFGSYTYSLWVEGRQVDARQMIIQKKMYSFVLFPDL